MKIVSGRNSRWQFERSADVGNLSVACGNGGLRGENRKNKYILILIYIIYYILLSLVVFIIYMYYIIIIQDIWVNASV